MIVLVNHKLSLHIYYLYVNRGFFLGGEGLHICITFDSLACITLYSSKLFSKKYIITISSGTAIIATVLFFFTRRILVIRAGDKLLFQVSIFKCGYLSLDST